MVERDVKGGRYDNSARAEQARLLQRKIIDAAAQALLENGWSGTTIAAIAARAGVSPETVYKRFGGKAGLLKAVYDVRMAGDDEPIPIVDRPAIQAMLTEPDPRRLAERYAALARDLIERAGPLVSVLLGVRDTDPELAAFIATTDAERLVGAGGFVSMMAFWTTLRVDPEQARDIVWTLTSPELYDLLVTRRGWSLDAYQDWLGRSLFEAVVESGSAGSSSGRRQEGRTP